jgi:hypothetical protein
MPEIVQLIDAKPGFHAVLVNPVTGQAEFHPVVLWGLIEEEDSAVGEVGPETATLVQQGIVPLIVPPDRKGQTLQPAYLYEGCIGVSAPNDAVENWVGEAAEYLAMRAAGRLNSGGQVETPTWH